MEDDFFKDYPPPGSTPTQTTEDQPSAETQMNETPMEAFVLSDQPEPLGDTQQQGLDEDEEHSLPDAPNGNGNGITNGAINLGPPPEDDDEPEPEAVTKWRADFAKRLENNVLNEKNVKAERAEKATKMLQTMHARWDRQRNDALDANKKQEQTILRSRDGVISRMAKKGESPNWDIIPQLADLTGTFKEGARDTSRMRQVILRMKTN